LFSKDALKQKSDSHPDHRKAADTRTSCDHIYKRANQSLHCLTTFIARSAAYLEAADAPLAQLERAHRLSAGVAVASAKLELQDIPSGKNPPGVVVPEKYTMFRTWCSTNTVIHR